MKSNTLNASILDGFKYKYKYFLNAKVFSNALESISNTVFKYL